MTIPFSQVPSSLRIPFVAVEFDNSKAQQGPSIQEYKVMLFGQKLAAGTQGELVRVNSQNESEIKALFGAGSHLHRLAKAYLENNLVTELNLIAIDDAGAANQAVGNILFSGSSIKAGTLAVMIGGDNFQVGVSEGDSPADIVAKLVTEIGDLDDAYITAVQNVTPEQIDFTAKNGGTLGNDLDIRFNFFPWRKIARKFGWCDHSNGHWKW